MDAMNLIGIQTVTDRQRDDVAGASAMCRW
jgi:hypothetical protein